MTEDEYDDLPDYDMSEIMDRVTDAEDIQRMMQSSNEDSKDKHTRVADATGDNAILPARDDIDDTITFILEDENDVGVFNGTIVEQGDVSMVVEVDERVDTIHRKIPTRNIILDALSKAFLQKQRGEQLTEELYECHREPEDPFVRDVLNEFESFEQAVQAMKTEYGYE